MMPSWKINIPGKRESFWVVPSTHLRLVITNFTVRPVGGIKVGLVCTFFFLAILCYSRAGIEVVLTRAGFMQVREIEQGEEVTEVFISMD